MLRRVSKGAARLLAIVFLCTTIALAASLAATWVYIERVMPVAGLPASASGPAEAPISPLLLHYRLDLPGRGEVFPAMASGGARDYWPVAVLGITNTSDRPVLQTVSAELPGWSVRQETTLTVAARSSTQVNLSPGLLPKALQNAEIRPVTLEIAVTSPDAGPTFVQTRTVHLHSGADIFWGKQFANAQFVARWVTPHDPAVLDLVSRARRWMPAGRMPGYNGDNNAAHLDRQVRTQAEAVFNALKQSRVTYVSSIFTFGNFTREAQRIRLPRETLSLSSANCIDVSVAFASAVENLDMDPVIVIVPGHAFTGIRLGPQSSEVLYLDLTVLPKGSFAGAVERAHAWLKKTPPDQVITVDVAAARALRIYPL